MKTQALIMMVLTNLVVAGFTAYFSWKVLTVHPTGMPDAPIDEDGPDYPRGG